MGYRFRGYALNESGQPTFKYEFEAQTVTDFYIPLKEGFDRVLTIVNRSPETKNPEVMLRLARGPIKAVDGVYVVNDQLKLSVEGAKVTLVDSDGAQELRAQLADGAKQEIRVKLRW